MEPRRGNLGKLSKPYKEYFKPLSVTNNSVGSRSAAAGHVSHNSNTIKFLEIWTFFGNFASIFTKIAILKEIQELIWSKKTDQF